jgi:hypothetical protein
MIHLASVLLSAHSDISYGNNAGTENAPICAKVCPIQTAPMKILVGILGFLAMMVSP